MTTTTSTIISNNIPTTTTALNRRRNGSGSKNATAAASSSSSSSSTFILSSKSKSNTKSSRCGGGVILFDSSSLSSSLSKKKVFPRRLRRRRAYSRLLAKVSATKPPQGGGGGEEAKKNNKNYRFTILSLVALALLLCNADRVIMSIVGLPMSKMNGWDVKVLGLIQSSFLFGYALTPIFGGVLADKINGARVLLGGLFGLVVGDDGDAVGGVDEIYSFVVLVSRCDGFRRRGGVAVYEQRGLAVGAGIRTVES